AADQLRTPAGVKQRVLEGFTQVVQLKPLRAQLGHDRPPIHVLVAGETRLALQQPQLLIDLPDAAFDGRRGGVAHPAVVRMIADPATAEVIEEDDLTVLPGLMDLHVHLGMQAGVNFPRILMTPRALALLYAVPNCAATLRAGFTTVRDAGLTPAGVKLAVERGLFPGPRLQVAVSILGQTGGHADPFMPCGVGLDFGSGLDVPAGVVDGVDDMRRRVREVLRSGADWIKLCTSGGVLSASDTPDAAQLTVEEIATAVYEAQAQDKGCMAHAMSAQGIKNALRAGVRTIEHGCFLDEEGIALMRQRG